MKKILSLLAVAAIAFTSCSKDDDNGGGSGSVSLTVEQKNRAILIDFSETWCPPCGSSGGPGFDSSLSIEGSKITAMKVYGSSSPSSMNSPISNGIATAYSVSGVPDFWVNNSELNPGGGVYSSAASNFNWVNNKANAFATEPVVAGVALSKSFVGDSMKVNTRVKFFQEQAANQDYNLAVYIVEDNIISNQSTNTGSVANYRHRNLLRVGNASVYTGVSINANAAIAVDQVFDKTFTLPVASTWNRNNLKVIGVIWKKGTTPAKVVNTNYIK
ncbi:MAG: Omp28-related outer membrane protein [Bacteroidota bacterium]